MERRLKNTGALRCRQWCR